MSLWRGNYIICNLRCFYDFLKRAHHIIQTWKTFFFFSTDISREVTLKSLNANDKAIITVAPFWFEIFPPHYIPQSQAWIPLLFFVNLASDDLMQFITFTLHSRHFLSDRIVEMFLKNDLFNIEATPFHRTTR